VNKPKHTPGPWAVDGRFNISATLGVQYNVSNHSATAAQLSANAHLIAAAPELLEGLELAYRIIEQELHAKGLVDQHIMDRLKATYQKATGGAK
jgi:hypothetical protein